MPEGGPEQVAAALEERELLEPLVESQTRVIVPRRGKVFEEDGTCKVAIIRPCVSRGRRLRGLPPIYTPRMLAENAGVFSGWLMYMDHLTEAMVETMRSRGRSIRELGGRVIESYYDPEFELPDDGDRGYQRGAVIGRVLPQPPVRAMLEADPDILHVSINAFPKAARKGAAPWDPSVEGMIIEGIRKTPEGSVDWVPRGGAGGRVLQEDDKLAVCLLEAFYDADVSEEQMPEFRNMTLQQLREAVASENPALAEEAGLIRSDAPPAPVRGGLTEADLERVLEEREAQLREEFEERILEEERRREVEVQEALSFRDDLRSRADHAQRLIKAAGLPTRWTEDLVRRYSVLPSGPSQALLVEADGEDAMGVLTERVHADIAHARDLLAEASGIPAVTGLGGAPSGPVTSGKRRGNAFRDFLSEGGTSVTDEDVENMVREGVN